MSTEFLAGVNHACTILERISEDHKQMGKRLQEQRSRTQVENTDKEKYLYLARVLDNQIALLRRGL